MRKVKVLLIALYSDKMLKNLEEIGICYIAAFLRNKGYDVMLSGVYENEIDYKKICEFAPDIIGTPVYSQSKDLVYRFINRVKEECSEAAICVGGFLPTYYGVEMMEENPLIDYAIRGEGESVFLELISAIEKNEGFENVKGLNYRKNNKIIVNEKQDLIEDYEALPFPSRDLLVENKLKIAQISSSRGCSGRCSFCCCPNFWQTNGKHKWRGRKVKRIVDEIENIKQNYGIDYFSLIENSFEDPGSNFRKVWDTAEEIVSRNLQIYYYLCFRTEFHKKATDELLDLLKKSGLCSVYLGIESFNENDLKVYKKIATVEDNIKAIELFRSAQINITIGFINFNPYSSFEGLRENIDLLEKYGFASHFPQIRRVRVFRGTSLYTMLENDGLLRESRYDDDYRYSYRDSRIEPLANFLDEEFVKVGSMLGTLVSIADYYSNDYLVTLTCYKRRFENERSDKALELVIDNELKVKELLAGLNTRSSGCFRRLLDFAENGWDQTQAQGIVREYLDDNYAKKMCIDLGRKKAELYLKLTKLDSKYKGYLI
ncbi:MAG: B12-binding domain-containing radical SAM protein [Clostridia bacterium]|nr:B12-binding domain-containing radical SAM protein [Clostridia bacterium]